MSLRSKTANLDQRVQISGSLLQGILCLFVVRNIEKAFQKMRTAADRHWPDGFDDRPRLSIRRQKHALRVIHRLAQIG